MAKVVQTLRTHWKKSVFFTGLSIYGAKYAKQKYDDNQLMRKLCLEASSYGQNLIPTGKPNIYFK